MSHTRNLVGLLLIALLWPSGSAAADPDIVPPELTAVEAQLIEDARELFGSAGLALPVSTLIDFHDATDPCADNLALYTNDEGPRIRICWTHDDPGVERRVRTQALVHELAHAWVDANVDETTRLAYLMFTGLESWRARGVEWSERGTEHAAELITWAVLDPEVKWIDFTLETCDRWAAAYSLLTGTVATDALHEPCRA